MTAPTSANWVNFCVLCSATTSPSYPQTQERCTHNFVLKQPLPFVSSWSLRLLNTSCAFVSSPPPAPPSQCLTDSRRSRDVCSENGFIPKGISNQVTGDDTSPLFRSEGLSCTTSSPEHPILSRTWTTVSFAGSASSSRAHSSLSHLKDWRNVEQG